MELRWVTVSCLFRRWLIFVASKLILICHLVYLFSGSPFIEFLKTSCMCLLNKQFVV